MLTAYIEIGFSLMEASEVVYTIVDKIEVPRPPTRTTTDAERHRAHGPQGPAVLDRRAAEQEAAA